MIFSSSGEAHIYMDGVEKASTLRSSGAIQGHVVPGAYNSQPVDMIWLGRGMGGGYDVANTGAIASVEIYERALSQAEVEDAMTKSYTEKVGMPP